MSVCILHESHPIYILFSSLFVQFERFNGQLRGHPHRLPELEDLRRVALRAPATGEHPDGAISRQLQTAHRERREAGHRY